MNSGTTSDNSVSQHTRIARLSLRLVNQFIEIKTSYVTGTRNANAGHKFNRQGINDTKHRRQLSRHVCLYDTLRYAFAKRRPCIAR